MGERDGVVPFDEKQAHSRCRAALQIRVGLVPTAGALHAVDCRRLIFLRPRSFERARRELA